MHKTEPIIYSTKISSISLVSQDRNLRVIFNISFSLTFHVHETTRSWWSYVLNYDCSHHLLFLNLHWSHLSLLFIFCLDLFHSNFFFFFFYIGIWLIRASLMAQWVKNPLAMPETWVQSLGWEDSLEEDIATHSSILAWSIPMDRGVWQASVHGVAKRRTWLSD